MKRDMDLMRLLLFKIEGAEESDISDYSDDQKLYHLRLLAMGGLVDTRRRVMAGHSADETLTRCSLTPAGHDFLDSARDDSVWRKALARTIAISGGVSLDILAAVLIVVVKEKLGFGQP